MHEIQKELKAHKGQTNKFGGYQYRSCEDILEAVKPLLHARELHLNITDEMVMLGDRFYVKATAMVLSGEKVRATATAYAREALAKKGMDESQITGSASSYARKYALNGLFAIDDTKDADTQDNTDKPQAKAPRINKKQMQAAVQGLLAGLEDQDELGVREIVAELSEDEQSFIWANFDTAQKSGIKALLHKARDVE